MIAIYLLYASHEQKFRLILFCRFIIHYYFISIYVLLWRYSSSKDFEEVQICVVIKHN